jgi:hypothetical protein
MFTPAAEVRAALGDQQLQRLLASGVLQIDE